MKRLVAVCGAITISATVLVSAPGASGAPLPVADETVTADEWVPSQIQPTEIPLNWSRATLSDEVTLDKYGRRPVMKLGGTGSFDSIFFLLACERPEQLDCLESFGIVDESTGEYRHRPFLRARTSVVDYRPDLPKGFVYTQHSTTWEIPGVEIEGYPAHLRVDGAFSPVGGHAFGFQTFIEDVPNIPAPYPNILGCIGYVVDPCFREPQMPTPTTLRVVLRTSWLDTAVVMARARNPVLAVEELGNGAHRVTLTGEAIPLQSSPEPGKDATQWVSSSIDFTVLDPRLTRIGSEECYRSGPLLVAYNGAMGSVPEWIPEEGRLKLNAFAAHFWADGKTVWRGYYETVIPEATARCLWGIDPRMTSALKVEVYGENGEEKAATTSIAFRDGEVRIRAYDFTYSEPTIAVKVTVKPGQRCYQSGAQVREFTCMKKGKRLVWAKVRR